jgi:hypothetical protein
LKFLTRRYGIWFVWRGTLFQTRLNIDSCNACFFEMLIPMDLKLRKATEQEYPTFRRRKLSKDTEEFLTNPERKKQAILLLSDLYYILSS